jgi:ABC-2 type transport system permease protein
LIIAMKFNVLFAIFRRNFISYFSNPTGYVFICVFVLLSSIAAFWPNEFFNSNLANLDQLNKWLPYIMLVFIPAITMSIWAEERRLGTDELLLTIPAGDLEVVLGKYLAAVAIFSCALAFSGLSNLFVLFWLGEPDFGLYVGNYVGYWIVGVTMLAIGMVASFLTSNVTVGFILAVIFNAPLVFASGADVIVSSFWTQEIRKWSIGAMFEDFGRGVISLSSVCYFVAITAVMLYLSMLLISRRHWWGGRDSQAYLSHYVARVLCLAVVVVCLTVFFTRYDSRLDVTVERLTALSPKTKELLRNLEPKHGVVVIDAFVSPEVPDLYVQTRTDLLNLLKEMKSRGGNKLDVRIHETDLYSPSAKLAEEQFEIAARRVPRRSGGAIDDDSIYLGVAVQSGPDKVVIPFIDRGIPLEYELIRSIGTVGRTQEDRKKLAVLKTDAQLESGRGDSGLMTELRKQYDVETIDPVKPIELTVVGKDGQRTRKYDVVLAVQPSSLNEQAMGHFVEMVKQGQPTAIFEDPLPFIPTWQVVGTSEERRPRQQNPFGMPGGPPGEPKGRIDQLWKLLGVEFHGNEVVWHKYNPYPQYQGFDPEIVFIGKGSHATKPFAEDHRATSGLQQMVFLFPGWISRGKETGPTYKPLVMTSTQAGTLSHTSSFQSDVVLPSFMGGAQINPNRRHVLPDQRREYAMAAHIKGKLKNDLPMHPGHDEKDGSHGEKEPAKKDGLSDEAPAKAEEINVVIVSDIDCLGSEIFDIRARGNDPNQEVAFNFDNVTFVLNVLDDLAGDERFLDVRKRRRLHRTLTKVEEAVKRAEESFMEQRAAYQKKFQDKVDEANNRLTEAVNRIRNNPNLSRTEMAQQIEVVREQEQRKLDTQRARLESERDSDIRKIDLARDQEVRSVERGYKMNAVILPPILPLLIGLVIFFNRRAREREGVPEARLRRSAEK